MRSLARILCFMFIVLMILLLLGPILHLLPRGHAQEPPQHWALYDDDEVRVVKIQDGQCSLYVAWGLHRTMSQSTPSHISIVTGAGCK